MKTRNELILEGNMTRDPELRYIASGSAVCKFGLAHDLTYGDNKKTMFLDVECWKDVAEFVAATFAKGAKVRIHGMLKQDHWEKDGQKRSKHYAVAFKVAAGDEQEPKAPEPGRPAAPAPPADSYDPVTGEGDSPIPF